jgi:hypothetical protein
MIKKQLQTLKKQRRIDAAIELLPLYDTWHKECLADHSSNETIIAAARMMRIARPYRQLGCPFQIEAAVGRWVCRILGHKWTSNGIVRKMEGL